MLSCWLPNCRCFIPANPFLLSPPTLLIFSLPPPPPPPLLLCFSLLPLSTFPLLPPTSSVSCFLFPPGEVFSKQSLKLSDFHKLSEKARGKQKRRERALRPKSSAGQKLVGSAHTACAYKILFRLTNLAAIKYSHCHKYSATVCNYT